jgi:hypothetical protein
MLKLESEIKIPLKKKEVQTIMASSKDWGIQTSEEDVDKILYGE